MTTGRINQVTALRGADDARGVAGLPALPSARARPAVLFMIASRTGGGIPAGRRSRVTSLFDALTCRWTPDGHPMPRGMTGRCRTPPSGPSRGGSVVTDFRPPHYGTLARLVKEVVKGAFCDFRSALHRASRGLCSRSPA